MWHIRKNKKQILWQFVKKTAEEETKVFQNPGIGWYTMYSFAIEDEMIPKELIWCLHAEETIAFVLLDIGSYRDRMLDETALEHLEQILGFFLEQQKDVILRPVYDREGKGKEREPEDLSQVTGHLKQIAEALKRMPNSVFAVQGTLIGNWGEMHGSRYLSAEDLRQLYQCMEENFPLQVVLAVRTPALWRTCCTEADLERHNRRLSLFDDALFGSETDLGTFGFRTREASEWTERWNRMEELRFWEQVCRYLPSGGETVLGEVEYSEHAVIHQMKEMHVSYLNHRYDLRVLEKWRQISCQMPGIWQGHSLYEYIEAHLGYRFVVENLEFISEKKRISLRFAVKNKGFGACWFETEVELIQETEAEWHRYPLGNLLQDLACEDHRQIVVPLKPEEGKIFLCAYRKSDCRMISFAHATSDHGMLYLGCLRRAACDSQTGNSV